MRCVYVPELGMYCRWQQWVQIMNAAFTDAQNLGLAFLAAWETEIAMRRPDACHERARKGREFRQLVER